MTITTVQEVLGLAKSVIDLLGYGVILTAFGIVILVVAIIDRLPGRG